MVGCYGGDSHVDAFYSALGGSVKYFYDCVCGVIVSS